MTSRLIMWVRVFAGFRAPQCCIGTSAPHPSQVFELKPPAAHQTQQGRKLYRRLS
jgi:hypothetical protein